MVKFRKQSRKHSRKQKGGFISFESLDDILEFLRNSHIISLTYGGSGIIYLARAKEPYNTKIKHLYPNNTFGQSVKELIIKVVIIDDTKGAEGINDKKLDIKYPNIVYDEKRTHSEINIPKSKTFQNECRITKVISELSSKDCRPLCPTFLFGDIYDRYTESNAQIVKFLRQVYMLLHEQYLQPLIEMNGYLKMPQYKFGIIIMESNVSHKSFYNMLQSKKDNKNSQKEKYRELVIKMLCIQVELALLGYIHNDPHYNNLLYDKNNKIYYDTDGRFLLLDFGRTVKFSELPALLPPKPKDHDTGGLEYIQSGPKLREYIDRLLKEKRYTELLKYLYFNFPVDPMDQNNILYTLSNITPDKVYYGYLCGAFDFVTDKPTGLTNYEIYGGETYVNRRIIELLASKQTHCPRIRKLLLNKSSTNPLAHSLYHNFPNNNSNNNAVSNTTHNPVLSNSEGESENNTNGASNVEVEF